MQGILSGIKVLDLSRILAGPLATQYLSDFGAEVTKVEAPWGDDTRHWGPPFATGFDGEEVANLPVNSLSNNVPIYDRKWKKNVTSIKKNLQIDFKSFKILESLKKILMSPNNAEKSWVWEQYDHTVMGDTIQKPGGDAGVVRIHKTNKAVAASVDSSATYCWAHPLTGGKQIVCESWRNLISVGAEPIAITNCLNFGNPEKEDNMGEFVECVQGIGEACKYLDYPVVSGNVSFYNETNNHSIKPTPTIGAVGLIKNIDNMC